MKLKYYDRGIITEASDGYRPSQPAQRFPFRAVQPPRVDNQNQPWYATNDQARWWSKGSPDTVQDYSVVTSNSAQDGSSQNMGDIWNVFNSFFGGANMKANLMDQTNVTGMPPDSGYANSAASYGADQTGTRKAPPPPTTSSGFWNSVNSFFMSFGNQARPPGPAPSADYQVGGDASGY